MKSSFHILLPVFVATVGLTLSCALGDPLDPAGFGSVYTDVKANYNCRTGDSGCIAPNGGKALGSKVGTACHTSYVNIISSGDKSLKAAAAAGGINDVHSVDYSVTSVLGSIYINDCIIVSGE